MGAEVLGFRRLAARNYFESRQGIASSYIKKNKIKNAREPVLLRFSEKREVQNLPQKNIKPEFSLCTE
jgi:hypothetical protein